MPEYYLKDFLPKSKARPRVLKTGGTYMPKEYMQWKQELRLRLVSSYPDIVPSPEQVYIAFEIQCPRKPRGDLDNLAGGLLDAIQVDKYSAGFGLIEDDRQVVRLAISWTPCTVPATLIGIWGEGQKDDWLRFIEGEPHG